MSDNYLIIGDDKYIKESELKKIREKIFLTPEEELNYSVYSHEEIDEIMNSLETVPFLSEKRLVVLKDAEGITEKAMSTILSYLERPFKTSILVLLSDSSLRKKKSYTKISKLVKEIKADKPAPATVKSWIKSFFKKEKIGISDEAADLLVELKGEDTVGIKTELDKLLSFSGGNRIEGEHVAELVGRSVTETVFKLVDAINAKDAKWTFEILNDLYEQKKQPQEIIGYLSWYMRMIQKIVLLELRKKSQNTISRELGYSPGYANRLIRQSKGYTPGKIRKWVQSLFNADRDIKTGQKEVALAMEILLINLLES